VQRSCHAAAAILRSNLLHGGVRDERRRSESLKVEHSTGTTTTIVIGRVLAQKMLLEAGRYLEQADESFGPRRLRSARILLRELRGAGAGRQRALAGLSIEALKQRAANANAEPIIWGITHGLFGSKDD
jgi:hypothetical protein